MFDAVTKACPDFLAVMTSFKIPWMRIDGGKDSFINQIPVCIVEMYKRGYLSETYFDSIDFLMDKDFYGNIITLRSECDHMSRSKVSFHPQVIGDQCRDRECVLKSLNNKQDKRKIYAQQILYGNLKYWKELLNH